DRRLLMANSTEHGEKLVVLPDVDAMLRACREAGLGQNRDHQRRKCAGEAVFVKAIDTSDDTVQCHVPSLAEDIWFAARALAEPEALQFSKEMLVLCKAIHPLYKLLLYSATSPWIFQVVALLDAVFGSLMLSAAFYGGRASPAVPACAGPDDLLANLTRDLLVSLGCMVVALAPLAVLCRRDRTLRRGSPDHERRAQLRRWLLKDVACIAGGLLWFAFCLLYIVLFLANVSQADADHWLICLTFRFVIMWVLIPFAAALLWMVIMRVFVELSGGSFVQTNISGLLRAVYRGGYDIPSVPLLLECDAGEGITRFRLEGGELCMSTDGMNWTHIESLEWLADPGAETLSAGPSLHGQVIDQAGRKATVESCILPELTRICEKARVGHTLPKSLEESQERFAVATESRHQEAAAPGGEVQRDQTQVTSEVADELAVTLEVADKLAVDSSAAAAAGLAARLADQPAQVPLRADAEPIKPTVLEAVGQASATAEVQQVRRAEQQAQEVQSPDRAAGPGLALPAAAMSGVSLDAVFLTVEQAEGLEEPVPERGSSQQEKRVKRVPVPASAPTQVGKLAGASVEASARRRASTSSFASSLDARGGQRPKGIDIIFRLFTGRGVLDSRPGGWH
ncbi:unnamed protein product, partial [Prorocentrum cordatum]